MPHPKRKPGESNRKYKHYRVTVTYTDGGTFGRVYTDREKAYTFAERQKRLPVVKSALVEEVT
jgi:hypothetical protein